MSFCKLPGEKTMSIKRIQAILWQEYYVTYRSVEVIFDIFVFALISLFLFGFLSTYLTGEAGGKAASYILLGMLLWEIVRIISYSVVMGSLWNMWFRNLSNLFITPLSVFEFLFAQTLSGFAKAILVVTINAVITVYVFGFNIFQLGPMLVLYILGLGLFAVAAGIMILGMIFRFGTRLQAFAWGLIPILQPLTAAFFPVVALPVPLQIVARIFPSTYVFEAVRYQMDTGMVDWNGLGISFALNGVFMILAILYFSWMFRVSRDTGQFARNES